MKRRIYLLACALICVSTAKVTAEPMTLTTVLSPVESIRMPFKDKTSHFVLMEQRQGVAEGTGLFAGSQVNEIGWHDITPGMSGDPIGYIELTSGDGDIAYLKWQARAVFQEGVKGPPIVHGTWEMVSGTGKIAGARGLGALQIGPGNGPGQPQRRYSLVGDLFLKP